MRKALVSLSLCGMVLALVCAFAAPVRASGTQMDVSRDFGIYTIDDVNRFGDDRAYSSQLGTDKDADAQLFTWTPESYGLKGSFGYYSGGAGGGGGGD